MSASLFHLSDVIGAKSVVRSSLKREEMKNQLKLSISIKHGALLKVRYSICVRVVN